MEQTKSSPHFMSSLRRAAPSCGAAAYSSEVEQAAADTRASLPRWDLSALYAGMGDPKLEADLTQAAEQARAFSARYQDTLLICSTGTTECIK